MMMIHQNYRIRMLLVFGALLHLPATTTARSCASLSNCTDCLNAYTCHWCDQDKSCHTKGSWHGCAWGAGTCSPVTPKGNSSCASHGTCADCALSSHLCHWCEFDNACHAIGSYKGCATGVDCYSNQRCRRSQPEALGVGWFQIPLGILIMVLSLAFLIIGCLSCFYNFVGNLRGAYNDLATLAASVSLRPPSIINARMSMGTDPFYSALETQLEDDEDNQEEQPRLSEIEDQNGPSNHEYTILEEENTDLDPNLTPQFNSRLDAEEPGDDFMVQESPHIKALYRSCSLLYTFVVTLILVLVAVLVLFYPQIPTYSVCNDAVRWSKIIAHLVSGKVDASFEILVSFKNPNHLSAVLQNGAGTFSFEDEPLGTFIIPPLQIQSMATTDLMLIAHATPNHNQAVKVAHAYMAGKLVLTAEFDAIIQIPALFDWSISRTVQNIPIDIYAAADRSLCHCPSWGDNHTAPLFLF